MRPSLGDPSRGVRAALLVLSGWGSGCTSPAATEISFCVEDDQCPGGVCLVDRTLGVTYCSAPCGSDGDCPPHQRCQAGSADVEVAAVSLCVDRVRSCQPSEACNGLDDDCDGTIDGEGCAPLVGCLDDAPCGAFVCRPYAGQPELLCGPPNAGADAYAACSSDDACRGGRCSGGQCLPLCRRFGGDECRGGFVCAEAADDPALPRHNLCQPECREPRDCTGARTCVWREVFEGMGLRSFVCGLPSADGRGLGAECAEDRQCAHGLCYDRRCTRRCDGPGASCADVEGSVCRRETIYFGGGLFETTVYLCGRAP